MSKQNRNLLAFLVVSAGVVLLSLAAALTLHVREAATIILFVPLLWGYMMLPLYGMVILAGTMAIVRVSLELIQAPASWSLGDMMFPVALYAGLLIPFYVYRRRQSILFHELLEARSLEARERLTSSLTHDFNNILSVILGTAQMLAKDKALSMDAAKDVNTILSASQQGTDLIRQMGRQASSPLESKDRVLADLSDLVDRQVNIMERMLQPNVVVERQLSSVPLPVRVNVSHLLRVLMNLCINARDAMNAKGTITIRTGTSYRNNRAYAELSVADTGSGIPPEIRRRLFEPFFTTKSPQGGVGLGLSIVQSIASSHGGIIEVETEVGKGSTFKFLLPMQEQPAVGAA